MSSLEVIQILFPLYLKCSTVSYLALQDFYAYQSLHRCLLRCLWFDLNAVVQQHGMLSSAVGCTVGVEGDAFVVLKYRQGLVQSWSIFISYLEIYLCRLHRFDHYFVDHCQRKFAKIKPQHLSTKYIFVQNDLAL